MDKKQNIQSKVKKLDELVNYFENNEDFDLDEGLVKYEEALKLVNDLQLEMESFELKIKKIEEKYLKEED